MATIRMSFRERKDPGTNAEGAPVPAPPGPAVELSGSYAWDDLGPEPGHFSLLESSVSARGGGWGSETVQLEFIGGVAYSYLDVEVDTGGQTANPTLGRYGPLIGLQITWEVVPRVALYGRGTFAWLVPDTTSGQAELGLRLALSDNVRLIGGYRHWRYRHEDFDLMGSTQADLDVKLDGYVFGLDLSF